MNNYFQTLKNARTVIIEMLEDRNYIIDDKFKNIDDETLKHLYYINSYDIIAKNSKNNKIYVKFFSHNKLKPTIIKEYLLNIYDSILEKDKDNIVIILNDKPTTTIKKILNEFNCEVFEIDMLQINITKHALVPKHELADDAEINQLIKKYNLPSIHKLPIINSNDPVIKYYNFPSNNVCKITRKSKTSINHVYYRYIK